MNFPLHDLHNWRESFLLVSVILDDIYLKNNFCIKGYILFAFNRISVMHNWCNRYR